MVNALEIKNLTVIFRDSYKALNSLDLNLESGRIVGLIGPSGAGKTTLIKSIVGRQKVNSGKLTVLGLAAGHSQLRSQVGYMTQEGSIYLDLTVVENLRYFTSVFGFKGKAAKNEINRVAKAVDLTNRLSNITQTLSGGEKRRLSLAIALIGQPRLLVLDEPTVGLDPVLRQQLWRLFNDLTEQGVTLLVSSHVMDEARRCDDLVLIRNGTILAHGSPQELQARTNSSNIEDSFVKLIQERI